MIILTVQEIINKRITELQLLECACETITDEEGTETTVQCDRCREIEEWQSKCVCGKCDDCIMLLISELEQTACTCTYKTIIVQQPSHDEQGLETTIDVEVEVVDVMCQRCVEIKGLQDLLNKREILRKAYIDEILWEHCEVDENGNITMHTGDIPEKSDIEKLKERLEISENALLELLIQQVNK